MTLVLWVSPLCNSFARGQNGLWILRDLDLWPCACQCGFPPWLYTTVLWGLVHGCAECLLSSAGTVGCSGCLGSALPATEIGVALFPSPSYILWQTHSHTRWEYSLLLTCLVTTFIVIVSGFLFAFLPFFVLDCNLFVRPPNLSGLVLSSNNKIQIMQREVFDKCLLREQIFLPEQGIRISVVHVRGK